VRRRWRCGGRWGWRRRRQVEARISLLVPFQTTDPGRLVLWEWLERYWGVALPDAEIIVGRDRRSQKRWWRKARPFSKTAAVNNAFRRSTGDIIVILDADAYLDAEVLRHCADRLRCARRCGARTWFVPYWHLFRLTELATEAVLASPPWDPIALHDPPPLADVEGMDGSGHGQRFGALVTVLPREAFEAVGGMDPRFRGWGGEDVAFLRALDTLWGRHLNMASSVFHLWHPRIDVGDWRDQQGSPWRVRMWSGQDRPRANDQLTSRYGAATGDRERMASLVAEAGRRKRRR